MNFHFDQSFIEIIILFANIGVGIINNSTKNRVKELHNAVALGKSQNDTQIADLKAEMNKNFLSKQDYYSTLPRHETK